MKKIPTLFKREFENHRVVKVLPEVTEGLEWVLTDPDVIGTVKIDGSCCAVINGEFYKRYDAKNGKPIPEGAIKCQEAPDPVTGHLPCWVKCDRHNHADVWFWKAYDLFITFHILLDGTYEAIGKHFNGNPYNMNTDFLERHGEKIITKNLLNPDAYLTCLTIREWLREHEVEGIVFWYKGEPICKIKRSDFGFEWPVRR